MKTFQKAAAQGDIFIVKVDSLPDGLKVIPRVENKQIVAHSETGHHHSIYDKRVEMLQDPKNPMVCYLKIDGEYADLVHERPWDQHEGLRLTGGLYKIHRQREGTLEAWRQVQD